MIMIFCVLSFILLLERREPEEIQLDNLRDAIPTIWEKKWIYAC